MELIAETVERIAGDTLIGTAGTRRNIDTLIYATGFDAASYDKGIEIIGFGGRSLAETWSESGPEAYLDATVAGFPNLLFIIGPNTGLGHNSMIHNMESQFNYMLSYLELLADQGISQLDLKPEVQTASNTSIQDQLSGMVWSTGSASCYQLDNGKNTTLWPGPTTTFRKRTLEVHADDYSFFLADTV